MTPDELLFTKTHEWIHLSADEAGGKVATMGITAYAVEALTDLVYIELPEVGRQVKAGESLSEVESVKAVSDIYSPVDGEVIASNDALVDALETLSTDPYGKGWIAKVKVGDESGLADLLDHAAYRQLCAEEEH